MAEYLIGNIKGPKGDPGTSPSITIEQTNTGATITIVDDSGTTTANIRNGIDASGEIIDLSDYATKAELAEVSASIPSITGLASKEYVNLAVPTRMSELENDTDFIIGGSNIVRSINGLTGDVVLNLNTGEAFEEIDPVFSASAAADITNEDITAWNRKQNALTAGEGITIENGVISSSATGPTYTAGTGIDITNDEISIDDTVVALQTDLPDVSGFVESSDLATVATSGDYTDLSNKPTNVSDFTNDAGYLTSADLAGYVESSDLATVATSGSYSDLSNKPTIPTATSDLTNDSGFITSSDLPSNELPAIASGDAGKVLKVNSGETGVEWGTVSGGTTYTAGNGINIVGTTISADTLVMATKTDLTYKQNNLTAGSNITLVNGVISATDTTYTAGTGISITNGVISLSLAQAESESF